MAVSYDFTASTVSLMTGDHPISGTALVGLVLIRQ